MLSAPVAALSGLVKSEETQNTEGFFWPVSADTLFSAVAELAEAGLSLLPFFNTAIRNGPGRERSASHILAIASESNSARAPTTRSALSIGSVFS
jgi:hypothetical protein